MVCLGSGATVWLAPSRAGRPDLADIFQEIEDDLKHEQYQKLWKRYGKLVIAAAVLLVVATAAIVAVRQWQEKTRLEHSAAYGAALAIANDNPADASAALTVLAEGNDGYGTLARFERAGLAGREGDAANAASQYLALAEDGDIDPMLRDLARVFWGYHALAAGESTEAVLAGMRPLADGDGPWRHVAREVQAAAALKAGSTEAAVEYFSAIADDPEAPQAIRARASEALAGLGN